MVLKALLALILIRTFFAADSLYSGGSEVIKKQIKYNRALKIAHLPIKIKKKEGFLDLETICMMNIKL